MKIIICLLEKNVCLSAAYVEMNHVNEMQNITRNKYRKRKHNELHI